MESGFPVSIPEDASGATSVIATTGRPKADDGIDHVFCCRDIDVSLCGLDISDTTVVFTLELPCVVCAEFDGTAYCPLFAECQGYPS
jgi:hypothetical protein